MRPSPTALWLGLSSALALLAVGWASARAPIYVSSWAVRVTQGYQEAERLARKFGFVNLGQVGGTWMDGTQRGPGRTSDLDTREGVPKTSSDRRNVPLHVQFGTPWPSAGPLGEVYSPRNLDSISGDSIKGARSQRCPFHHIPRSSLTTSISIYGTAEWPSSP